MRVIRLLILALMLSGCRPLPLYTPEVQARPESVGFGGHTSLRLYGAEIADYRFMGAREGPDGRWTIRLDPVYLGVWTVPAELTVRPGESLVLGADPSVLVQVVEIRPSRITLRALAVYNPEQHK